MWFNGKKETLSREKIFITNDSLFSNDGYKKTNRRVVVLNNDKSAAMVCKIKSLKGKNRNLREKLIPIEGYPCLPKPRGVDSNLNKQTFNGRPISFK